MAFDDEFNKGGYVGINHVGERKTNLSDGFFGKEKPIFAWLTLCANLEM